MNQEYQQILEELEISKQIDMGPRWQTQELDLFLENFRNSGLEQLDLIIQQLTELSFSRSIKNLISLYIKNKNILKLNKQIKGIELAAILEDYYENMPFTPVLQPQQQPIGQNELDNLLQQQQQNKPLNEQQQSSQTQVQAKKKKTQKQHKNSIEIENLAQESGQVMNSNVNIGINNNGISNINNGNHNNVNINNGKSLGSGGRKKKVFKGHNFNKFDKEPMARIYNLEQSYTSCNGKHPKKQIRQNMEGSTSYYTKFVENEYFYSHIDKCFLQYNEFEHLMQKAGLGNIQKLKKKEWFLLKKAMGKPRRFSNNFLMQERSKLNSFRGLVRAYLFEPDVYDIRDRLKNEFILKQIRELVPFSVGQIVMAVHPICGHFHQGSILTTNGPNIIIKFQTNELGVHKVMDSKISLENFQEGAVTSNNLRNEINYESNESVQQKQQFQLQQNTNGNLLNIHNNNNNNTNNEFSNSDNEEENQNLSSKNILQGLDIDAMAFLIKILDRKTILINQLREFNDIAEKHREQIDDVSDEFYQEYGWTGVQINLIDDALKHIITKFRLRGLNHYNDIDMISGNLGKILQTPLNFIENELDGSQNPQQQSALSSIKHIQNRQNEEKLVNQIEEIVEQVEQEIVEQKQLNKLKNQKEQQLNIIQQELNQDFGQNFEQKQDNNSDSQSNKQIQNNSSININGKKEIKQQAQINNDKNNNNNDDNNKNTNEMEIEEQTQLNEPNKQEQNKQQNDNLIDNNKDKSIFEKIEIEEEQQQQIKQQQNQQLTEEKLKLLRQIRLDQKENESYDLKNLTMGCMGVLMTLKNKGEIDITQSRFIEDVSQQIFPDFQNQFFDFQNLVLNLNTKQDHSSSNNNNQQLQQNSRDSNGDNQYNLMQNGDIVLNNN